MRLTNLESRVFIGLVLATTALFLWIVRDFMGPVFWAAVLAVLFQPVYRRYTRLLPGRTGIAAALGTITVVFAVLVPFGLLLFAVARQAVSLYEQIVAGNVGVSAPIEFVERQLPIVADLMARYGIDIARVRESVENAAVAAGQYIGGQALTIGQNALTLTIMFALMLYFLFFFFRDGERITASMIRALPMGDERELRLFQKFAEVSRATVKGTLVVATVQGALGGIMFAIVGIEAAVFWGVVMGVLSLLPAVGAFLIWAPAAAIFIATGVFWKAIFLIIAGMLAVGLVDNILRPVLVGRQTKMPDYLVLLATLGGLTVFGLTGFVAGPMIAALFLVVWEMFSEEYAPLDSSEPTVAPTAVPDRVAPGDVTAEGAGTPLPGE